MLFKQSLKQAQISPDKKEKNCLGKEVEMLLHGNSPTGHCLPLQMQKKLGSPSLFMDSYFRCSMCFPPLQSVLLGLG